MKKNSKKQSTNYEALSEELSDKEIVDAYVLPSELSDEDKKVRHEEFVRLRLVQLAELSDEEIRLGELMRMKIHLADYASGQEYNSSYSFGSQLKRYLKITDRSQSQFATEINMHKTRLSRIVNDRENPGVDLMYRLEKHSKKILPASLWYRIHSIKLENEIRENKIDRDAQYEKVLRTYDLRSTG